MHRVVVTGIGVVSPNGIGRRSVRRGDRRGAVGRRFDRELRHLGPGDQDRGRGQELRRAALPGRAQEERQADEPGGAVRGRRRGAGGRGRRAGPGQARPRAVRRLHGDRDHADRRRRAGRPDRSQGIGPDGDVRHRPVRAGPVGVDLPALAAQAPAEHGRGAHLDPAPRDGAEQHDRDRLRGGDPGGRRGVPADRPRRRRRDAGRRLRQPARPPAPGRLLRR